MQSSRDIFAVLQRAARMRQDGSFYAAAAVSLTSFSSFSRNARDTLREMRNQRELQNIPIIPGRYLSSYIEELYGEVESAFFLFR